VLVIVEETFDTPRSLQQVHKIINKEEQAILHKNWIESLEDAI